MVAVAGLHLMVAGIAAAGFQPDWESLRTHRIPEWFKDAKFGVWTVWGPHAVPAYGSEWYGHNMYRKDSDVYKYHVARYGHILVCKGRRRQPVRGYGGRPDRLRPPAGKPGRGTNSRRSKWARSSLTGPADTP